MKCHKCNQEMQEGFIPILRGTFIWFPKGEKMPWDSNYVPDNGIQLSETALIKRKKKTAYHCPKCHIITMSTIDENK